MVRKPSILIVLAEEMNMLNLICMCPFYGKNALQKLIRRQCKQCITLHIIKPIRSIESCLLMMWVTRKHRYGILEKYILKCQVIFFNQIFQAALFIFFILFFKRIILFRLSNFENIRYHI